MTHELEADGNDTGQVNFEVSGVIPFLAGENQQFLRVAADSAKTEDEAERAMQWWAVDSLDEIPVGNRATRRSFRHFALMPLFVQRTCLDGLRMALSACGQEVTEAEQSGLVIGDIGPPAVGGAVPSVRHGALLEASDAAQGAYDQLGRISARAIQLLVGVRIGAVPSLVADIEGDRQQEQDFIRLYSQPNHEMTGAVLGQYRLLCSALELADATNPEGPGFLSALEYRLKSGGYDKQLIKYKLRNLSDKDDESTPMQQQATFLRAVLGSLSLDGRAHTDNDITQAIIDNMTSLPRNIKNEITMDRKLLLEEFKRRRQATLSFMESRWLTVEIGKLSETIADVDRRINTRLVALGVAKHRLDPQLTPGSKKRRSPKEPTDSIDSSLPELSVQTEATNANVIAGVVYSAKGVPTTETLGKFLQDPARCTDKPGYRETIQAALQHIAMHYGTGSRNSGIKRLGSEDLFELKASEAAGFRSPPWLRQHRIIFGVEEAVDGGGRAVIYLVDVVNRRNLRGWLRNKLNKY